MDRGVARNLAKQYVDPVSLHTAAEYDRAVLRMGGLHWLDYAKGHAVTKRAAGVLRAAWRRQTARDLLDAIGLSEKAPTVDERHAARVRMDELATALLGEGLSQSRYQPPAGAQRAGAQSKRKTLRNLPADWRQQILDKAKAEDKPLVAALMYGARPEEIRKGVIFYRLNHYTLMVTIAGAKVKDRAGQKERRLTVYNDEAVMAAIGLADKQSLVAQSDAGQAFQKRLIRLARSLGFDAVAAYSFRHAWAADWKAMKRPPTEVAMLLGQQSERMQQHYGHAKQGNRKGGRSVDVDVTASSPTRPSSTVGLEQRVRHKTRSAPKSSRLSR